MQNDKTVDDPNPANRFISRLPGWLIVGTSFVSIITAVVVLRSSTFSAPAIVNLVVAVSALVVALLAVGRKLWRPSVTLLILIAIIAVTGMFSSLLFREDYLGGSCGEFDWQSNSSPARINGIQGLATFGSVRRSRKRNCPNG